MYITIFDLYTAYQVWVMLSRRRRKSKFCTIHFFILYFAYVPFECVYFIHERKVPSLCEQAALRSLYGNKSLHPLTFRLSISFYHCCVSTIYSRYGCAVALIFFVLQPEMCISVILDHPLYLSFSLSLPPVQTSPVILNAILRSGCR